MSAAIHSTDGALILVLNCGSSSIKFALFAAGQGGVAQQSEWSGKVEGIGREKTLYRAGGLQAETLVFAPEQAHHEALAHIREKVVEQLAGRRLHAVAHRVVHGGSKYFAPVRIDAAVLADLKTYVPLAPLHQPFALEAIEVLLASRPDIAQVACFDTAFHHTVPQVEQMLALPYDAWERGLRRYGFHGLSYEYQSLVLEQRYGSVARGKVIVAHLGSGASLCAMENLASVGTTMGFSALDGLMMGTRCGALDPGAVIYLMEIEKLSLEKVAHVLYHESGLLGISGVSADPPVLLAQEGRQDETGERIRAALALYVRRIVREIGALTAVLGGLDMLVFTAGIGEHSAVLRQRICDELKFVGPVLDGEANARNASVISTAHSRIVVGVEPANEEWVAARHAARAVLS
ncbi:acetate/propionate family kinase [Janthinobacterium sp. J1-1]|uniref:acetate/propionate family kinase n=1 Tax=Janthinobacterium sp. J1-1 TaxID=3065910 RepID=UPI0028115543|nr:acetate/propionate family kinase [Janthinobacterium sp. J1-1]